MIVVVETAVVLLLQAMSLRNPPGASVYMLGVLAITIVWGGRLGIVTALVSTAVFNYFFVPPAGLHLTSPHDAVRLLLFAVTVLVGGGLASVARTYARDARRRALEAETVARLTRVFLGNDLEDGLRAASQCVADRFGLRSAALDLSETGHADRTPGDIVISTGDEAQPKARLIVPDGTPAPVRQRIRDGVGDPLASMLCAALERDRLLSSLRSSRARTEALLAEQTALRRVATLVARGGSQDRVFAAVTGELHQLFTGCRTALVRYEPAGDVFVASERDEQGDLLPRRPNQPISDDGIMGTMVRTECAVQVDYDAVQGPVAEQMRQLGVHRGIGVPIVVDGDLWGAALVVSYQRDPVPPDAEARLRAFTELVGTAIATAESRASLAASRSRLVTAADDARRRIERDLHDGAQQRIIALALQLRLATDTVQDLAAARRLLSGAVQALTEIHQSLSDLARGIHPVLLAQGGVAPTLRTLARRSVVPCDLDLCVPRRLPEPVEVAVYYVVAEALTNIAKHARATLACVAVKADERRVRVTVSDDGVGGADPAAGTGLVGLRDRLEALGGQLSVMSAPGRGTTLQVELPLDKPGGIPAREAADDEAAVASGDSVGYRA
ncbi:DUF4118 domain-containing protein [Dactylosporangium sp. McL0621]|uniref:sensor histidine kinase n=1 Tax=Dactylosporangium sp. McL0621 TaxID=3415678 RepID=UPI003CF0C2DF